MLRIAAYLPIQLWILDMLFTTGIRPASLLIIPVYCWVKIGLDLLGSEKDARPIWAQVLLAWAWPLIIYMYWNNESNFSLKLNGVAIGEIDRVHFNKSLCKSFRDPYVYLQQLNDWIGKGCIAFIVSAGTASLIFFAVMLWLAQHDHALLFDIIRRWSVKDNLLYYSDAVRIGSTMTLVLWLRLIKNQFKEISLNDLRIELGQPAVGKLKLVKIDIS